MTQFRIFAAELSIAEGVRQERGYNARIVEPPPDSPEARKGALIVLLELSGPARNKRRHLRHLLNTVQSAYYTGPEEVPAALTHAIEAAHRALVHINATAPEGEGQRVGNVSCLALRAGELYLAQVGATTAAVLLPTGLHWFSPLEEEAPIPMGTERGVIPKVSRVDVTPGTVILLLDSGWVGQMDAVLFRRAVSRVHPAEVLEHLAAAVDVPNVSALAATLGELAGAPPSPAEEQETMRARAEALGERLVDTVSTLTERILPEEEETGLGEVSPMPEPPPIPRPRLWPFRRRKRAKRGRSWLWTLVALIPLLAVLVTSGVWWYQGRERALRYQTALAEAITAINEATKAQDPDEARQHLRQAQRALQEAEELMPGSEQVARLQQEVHDRFQVIDRVKPLYVAWPLVRYRGEGRDMARVIVEGDDIYVLDRGGDEVIHHRLDETGEALAEGQTERLLGRGDTVDNRTIGDLVDITWLPAGQVVDVSGVLALDGAGALFKYDVLRGLQSLPLLLPDGWTSPRRVLTYADRFYVLDPGAETVFRFLPGSNGYTVPAESYFQVPVRLSGVQDFAIDGNVYLLFPDGRVLRYFGGNQTDFELRGLDMPLSQPTAIFTNDRIQHIYIADTGNQRVVVLDKEGTFVAQLTAGEGLEIDLDAVRDIAVTDDETGLFLLMADSLWRAPIPLP